MTVFTFISDDLLKTVRQLPRGNKKQTGLVAHKAPVNHRLNSFIKITDTHKLDIDDYSAPHITFTGLVT